MAELIGVVVSGAAGKMGRTVVAAVRGAADMDLVAEIDEGDDLGAALARPQASVLVDFSTPAAGLANAEAAVAAGISPVIGTTGLPADGVARIETSCADQRIGGGVIPNFALGAVLMVRLAEIASPYFDAVEVVEAHADTKLDAPSGTALHTADRLAAARTGRGFAHNDPEKTTLAGARGGERGGVGVHSLRLPGLVADQEVVFGALGQTLTIAHRTTSRECYMPGVLATVRAVARSRRFYHSLDEVLGLVPLGGDA